MKIGIFGSESDTQCKKLKEILNNSGCETLIVETSSINNGISFSFDSEDFIYNGINTKDVNAWFFRYTMSPLPPAFIMDNEYYLYKNWLTEYMYKRERIGYQFSWLNILSAKGVPVINPPENGIVIQLKPFQLAIAKEIGLKIPKTLISNDPEMVKNFVNETKNVVYKPSMGGGLCHSFIDDDFKRLNEITKSPVTFQESINGSCIRVTIIGDEIVSSVVIESNYLDYRADPNYFSGKQEYKAIKLPDDISKKTIQLMKECGLLFSGVDFILNEKNEFIFIEANSSPNYLDIEEKMKHPITDKLANYLIRLAYSPEIYKSTMNQTRRTKSFVSYANPFKTEEYFGGPFERDRF